MTRWLLALLVIAILGCGLGVLAWVRRGQDESLPYTEKPRACGLRGKGLRLR